MNRRPLWLIVIGAVVLGVILVALSGVLSATNGPAGSAPPSASRAPAASASAPTAVASGSPVAVAAASSATSPGAAPTCVETPGIVIVRATDPATGFPVKVEWTALGPAGDLFLTQKTIVVASGPGCPSARPTGTP